MNTPAESVDGRGCFFTKFSELWDAAGSPKPAAVVHAAGLDKNNGTKRISDWRGGRHVPHEFTEFQRVLEVLIKKACARHASGNSPLYNLASWTRWHGEAASPNVKAAVDETAGNELRVHAADALALGVHPAPSVSDAPETGLPALPVYLPRHHDDVLRDQLRSSASGSPGSFALLVGGSTSGKTRALYEALRAVVPGWLVLWPRDAEDLVDLLLSGRFTAGTVLWLNETQRYLEGAAGARAPAHLNRLLAITPGAVAVGSMWRKPYLEELTARGTPGDPHAAARELLESPLTDLISVPDHLDLSQQAELAELAARSGDRRLLAALEACGPDGYVFQHVTGGPELVDAYQDGGLFTPVEHALITSALDARRFGHRGPIPDRLLQAAADGYLKPHERRGEPDWAVTALNAITSGERADGTRTSIRKALTALRASRSRSGQAAAEYEPDDYLDQQNRSSRQASLGSPELWDALADHASNTDDMHRLGEAACDLRLYRYATFLFRRAASAGHAKAAARMIRTPLAGLRTTQ